MIAQGSHECSEPLRFQLGRSFRYPQVDFVRRWSEKTEIGIGRFPRWLGIGASKFYDWRQRYGRVNEHNGWIPRDFWLEPWEKILPVMRAASTSPVEAPQNT